MYVQHSHQSIPSAISQTTSFGPRRNELYIFNSGGKLLLVCRWNTTETLWGSRCQCLHCYHQPCNQETCCVKQQHQPKHGPYPSLPSLLCFWKSIWMDTLIFWFISHIQLLAPFWITWNHELATSEPLNQATCIHTPWCLPDPSSIPTVWRTWKPR